jgi:prepilin-type N-terminal cleavage/methylation domain-containing protein
LSRIVFPALAIVLGLLFGSIYLATYEAAFGIQPDVIFRVSLSSVFDLGKYGHVPVVGILFCCCDFLSCLAFAGFCGRAWIWLPALVALAGWTSLRIFTPFPLTRLGGLPSFAEYLAYGIGMLGLHVLSGWLLSKFAVALDLGGKSVHKSVASASQPRKRSDFGFTLIELLTVIAVLLILAAIVFPIIARAKRSTYGTEDINNLRQTYAAVCLYENDSDAASPPSLLTLVPRYLPTVALASHLDSRITEPSIDWPANVWVDDRGYDGPYAAVASPFIISFAYLKPFEMRFLKTPPVFTDGRIPIESAYTAYREDPRVGMLLDPAIGDCRGDCRSADASPGQPTTDTLAWEVVRMDGSAVHRDLPYCGPQGYSYEQMFLFWPLCDGSSAIG